MQQYWPVKLAVTLTLSASTFIYIYPVLYSYVLRPIGWILSPITTLFLRLMCSGYCERKDTGTSSLLIVVLLVYSVAATIYIYHLHHPQPSQHKEVEIDDKKAD